MVNIGGAIAQGAVIAVTIKAIDNFSNTFQKATKGTNKLSSVFKIGAKAAVAFGVGLTALGVTAVKSAAKAEGSWNKFNTVFGEGSEEMKSFVNELRKEMPTATHEIARMGADLQDLLVPMGLARNEAQDLTKQSLDLANKIAAFNDVDPTRVLEAMKSGFVGQSEPLRQFGIDARITSLEAVALKNDLLGTASSFEELDPAMRMAVQSQALMIQMTNQSADAINGFEDNQDSLIRRTQEISAVFGDLKVRLGTILIPVVTDLADIFLNDVLPAIEPLIPVIGDFLKKALESIAPYLPRIFEGLQRFVEVAIKLSDALEPFLEPLREIAFIIMDALMDVIEPLIPSIKDLAFVFGDFLKALIPVINPIAKLVASIFKIIGESGIAVMISLFKALIPILETLAPIIDLIAGAIRILVELIGSLFQWMSELGQSSFGKVISGIFSLLNPASMIKLITGGTKRVNDAIITKKGDIVETSPQDTIIATKTPGGMGNNFVFNIEKIQGTDPEEMMVAFQRELNKKISLA